MMLITQTGVRWMARGLVLVSIFAAAETALHANAQFLNEVTISRDRIRLSDLLAQSVDPQLRAEAGNVDLGRAPEPGSFRRFTAEQLRAATRGSLALDPPRQVIVRRAGWPVSTESIAGALQSVKLPPGPVEILGAPVTRTPDAALTISDTHLGSHPRTLLVRFACRVRTDCAPFWGELENAGGLALRASPPRPSHTAIHPIVPLVEPDHTAILVCVEPGLKIRLRVRPLTRAGMGDAVKVFDPETRRTFLARVTARDLVESDLQEVR